jgi:hypothetical protein
MKSLDKIEGIIIRSNEESINITDQVSEINFYQNIYEPFVTGNIVLTDSASSRLTRLFKDTIVGKGEEILVKFSTKTTSASDREQEANIEKYYIYKTVILPLLHSSSNNNEQALAFYFSSATMFQNEFKKVRKPYSGKLSDIVKNIAKDYLSIDINDENLQETKDTKFKVIIPSLNPLQAISWLSARAYTEEKQKASSPTRSVINKWFKPANWDSNWMKKKKKKKTEDTIKNNNFVFYEDLDHNFHFKSIGSMFKKESAISGKLNSEGIVLSVRRNNITSHSADFAAIQMLSKSISPLTNVKNGMYASTLLTFDLTRKTYAKQTMRYDELFNAQDHFYKNQLVDPSFNSTKNILNSVYDHPETVVKFYPKSTYLYSDKGIKESPLSASTPVNDCHNWALERMASIEAMDQEGLDIELKGNVTFQLGDVVDFERQEYRERVSFGFSKDYDNLFTGKYIITKIKHSLENGKDMVGWNLRTFLSLRRDSTYGGEG